MEACGNGAGLQVEDVSDVGQRPLIVIKEVYERLLVGLQLGDGLAKVADAPLILEGVIDLRIRDLRLVIYADVPHALLAQPRDGGGIGDSANPCAERGTTAKGGTSRDTSAKASGPYRSRK